MYVRSRLKISHMRVLKYLLGLHILNIDLVFGTLMTLSTKQIVYIIEILNMLENSSFVFFKRYRTNKVILCI